ncbi:hypothetical protein L1049_002875 [Liquidambar formosana]|uniref:DUF7950 domain-containing protein n=1 Tax=Liquidambar formosana TaxID=63359 RepID=A0AAP0R722_LIQFO
MDGGEGWFMASCGGVGGGGGGGGHDESIIDRIMLRYRPIAPKPATTGSVTGFISPERNVFVGNRRGKRKYVKIRKNKTYNRKKRTTPDVERKDGVDKTFETLQLLPEKTERDKDSPEGGSWCNLDLTVPAGPVLQDSSSWLNFKPAINDNFKMGGLHYGESDLRLAEMGRFRVVESWVTVERVNACMEGGGGGLGSTDVEKRRNLELDTCPGFISDGYNRVEWVNEAYKRMTGSDGGGGTAASPETMVWLVIKEKLLYPVFTSRVRVQYTCGKEKCSKTMPCDTWRMDCGGFAWRLDVKAALSLGR